ncbi:MAG: hypothetical protein HY302_06605 [Opitutae bacterium]|nr:hypothetical protein [Opitutae bacterium]
MTSPRATPSSARLLLAAAAIWLVSVTLCSTRVVAEPPHEHGAVAEGHAHSHDGGHAHGKTSDDGCGCESFKAFSARTADSAKLAAPAATLLFALVAADDFIFDQEPPALPVQSTGPPETESFAKHFLVRCLLSQAPPVMA